MSAPFARARAMMALIAAAMGDSTKLAAIGQYVSRGHGRAPRRMCQTNFRKPVGKYLPHQGKQECARRLRNMVGAH